MPTMLIVGATSGIARATARLFAESGWRLQLAGRNQERLRAVAEELGVEAELFPFDALDADSRSRLWERLPACPDAVLCAVGLLGDQAEAQRDPAVALRVMESNFTGLVPLLTQAASAFEVRGSGLIIGVGSVAGDRGRASNYVYGAAKAGFAAYLSGLRARLHGSGVRRDGDAVRASRPRPSRGLARPRRPRHPSGRPARSRRALHPPLVAPPPRRIPHPPGKSGEEAEGVK